MPIHLLPVALANQIAAGEVIERPASVVKELVENSLDAGADQISVEIEQGGRRRIRIRDNGAGIEKAELPLALSRHATSKISCLADLEAIMSMGFRGEALASIASVSRLRLTSRPAGQPEAWEAWVEGRDMQAQLTPASHPDGTTVDVQDLFFNTPARRKFLRTDKTEFGHIDEVVRRIALGRFDVRLNLTHNQKLVRSYPAATNKEQFLNRLTKVCGPAFTDHAIYLEQQTGPVRLHGWIAPAAHCRHQGDVQYFYVNGRMMRDRLLAHAIRQAYADSLNDERSPTFVLYLELPPTDVDVNVHPAKHEVRFHQARQIHDFVLQSLRPALRESTQPDPAPAGHQYQQAGTALRQQLRELKPAASTPLPGVMGGRAAAPPPALVSELDYKQGYQLLQVVAERFALVNNPALPEPLALLDLQRVQQKQLAQQLATQWQTGLAGQPLLIPVQVTNPADCKRLRAMDSQRLARLGVQLTSNGRHLTVQQVPAPLRQTDVSRTLMELVGLLEKSAMEPTAELWLWLALQQVACHFSLTRAEHWLQVWHDELGQPGEFLLPLPLPELPEALR
ncbi:DNA mismatch repair endonuclease MutL [Pseudidiomarina sp.]|uniref:DNA mismatch repair endonuclease MutL n=1 Tax=Pseudidiomarina sp. TaxID=2081707 RepID=UPI00299EBED6|nr:DNA mismatch repair endonuclease MutL [Pseudidiomarina sp.]MDX1706721.1 DNA mismatch repair endonuclease MutL [Pseudidiomarina sp.]